MTATATTTISRSTTTKRVQGSISGVPAIDYGENGNLVPETYELTVETVTTITGRTLTTTNHYSLKLHATNDAGHIQDAIFNYPEPSKAGAWNHGWGFAGHLSEAPTDALKAVFDATAIDLINLIS